MALHAKSILKVLLLMALCSCGIRRKASDIRQKPLWNQQSGPTVRNSTPRSSRSWKHVMFFAFGGSHCTEQLNIARTLLEQGQEVTFVTIDLPFVNDFPFTKEYPEKLHILKNEAITEGYDPEEQPNLTKAFFEYVGEDPRDIAPAGDILWEVAAYTKWPFFAQVAADAQPDAIVFDVVTDGYGKYLAKEFGVPSYGSIPIPISSPQGHADEWQVTAPPGDLRNKAAQELTQLWRGKGWIEGNDLDLTGADLTYADYTFSYSSPLMEKDNYLLMKDKNWINGDIIFIGRDYTYDLEQAQLPDDDNEFLNQIDRLREGKKVAFLSLGTQARQPEYFNDYVFESLANKPYVVILQLCSTPGQHEDVDQRIFERFSASAKKPDNFIVYCALKSHTVVLRVLQRADVLLTHVGRNTMMEAVSQGVPVVTLPVRGDQYDNSEKMLQEGLGKAVPTMKAGLVNHGEWQEIPTPQAKAAFIKELQEVVDNVINDDELKRVVKDKKPLASGHGPKVAADIILGKLAPEDYVTDPETIRSESKHSIRGYLRACQEMLATALALIS